MDRLAFAVFMVLMVAVVVGSLTWQSSRSNGLLQKWADANGYRIVERKRAWMKGPFFWTGSDGQTVYRVVVDDGSAILRGAWVLCGSSMWGLWSDRTEVRWDEARWEN